MARKILLADDSVTAQNMGRKILADAGYEVLTVNNGSAALKRVTESKPDLIVLDVYMPGYSGLEVCQRLKEAPETAHIPILLTVGKLEPFKPDEARRARADAHIVKPFEASELLTALARLEDRMVPHADGARFSTSVSGVERFGGDRGDANTDPDTGWKSRLRFPSKKKKEEPEPEPEDVANFRDYKKGKGKKAAASSAFAVSAPPPPGQEPGLVPDIPRDITPEELDALSALAAKLDGPIPAAENIASLAEKVGPASQAEPLPTPAVAESQVKTEARTELEAKAEAKPEANLPESSLEEAKAQAAAEPSVAPVVAKSAVEFPVAPGEIPAANATDAAAPISSPIPTIAVDSASLVEAPAPIDRQDEPIFAAAPAEEKTEIRPAETVAASPAPQPAEAQVETNPEQETEKPAVEAVSQPEIAPAQVVAESSPASEPTPVVEPAPIAASAQAPAPEEVAAPSEEELAEALRLLTPSTNHAESAIPSHGTLVAAGQLLAEEAARNAASSSRWVAQVVAVSPEEAAISLEAEMFRTFAGAGASTEIESATVSSRVSAIAEAVENRLAATSAGTTEPQPPTPAVSADINAATSISPQETSPSSVEAAQKEDTHKEEEPDEPAPASTFADAIAYQEPEPVSTAPAAADREGPAAAAVAGAQNQNPGSEFEEQDAMAKEKGKSSGKSGWHQIHNTPASVAKTDVVEAAKQPEAAEAPKAMAAAASADGSGMPDPGAIANIVDSVLADLRPKIVEEIAKKLAGK